MAVKLYGTSPKSIPQTEEIEYKSFTFSAGEIQVRLPDISSYENLIIESKFPTSADLMEVFLIYSAINEVLNFDGSVTLFLPYLPYSRQDRTCYPGEAFSLYAFAKLLATQSRNKDRVVTWDVHSEIAERIFKQQGLDLINVSVEDLLGRFLKKGVTFDPNAVIVAPDKGARLRASLGAKAIGSNEVFYAEKVRNPDDGSISSISFNSGVEGPFSFEGRHVLIVDDICDGGRTFIELAKVLRKENPSSITLYVTHGIFSRGFEVFFDSSKYSLLIDRILTPNLFPGLEIPKGCPRGVNAPGMMKMTQYPTVITLN